MQNISFLETFKFGLETVFSNKNFFTKLLLHSAKTFILWCVAGLLTITISIGIPMTIICMILGIPSELIKNYGQNIGAFCGGILMFFIITIILSGWKKVGLYFIDNGTLSLEQFFLPKKTIFKFLIGYVALALSLILPILFLLILNVILFKTFFPQLTFIFMIILAILMLMAMFSYFYLFSRHYILNSLIVDKNTNIIESVKTSFRTKVDFENLLKLYIVYLGYIFLAATGYMFLKFFAINSFFQFTTAIISYSLILPLGLSEAYFWRKLSPSN